MSNEKLLTIGTLAALCVMAAFSMHAKAAGQEGMVVVRDPLTGQLRAPTADELKELRANAPATAGLAAPRTPVPVTRADGSRGMRLGEKGLVYDVVTRGPDGKLTRECVQGANLDHRHGEPKDESR
jgi:hypothetical protein